jgi:hypothetical protein
LRAPMPIREILGQLPARGAEAGGLLGPADAKPRHDSAR